MSKIKKLCLVMLVVINVNLAYAQKKIVVLTFDDATSSDYNFVAPLLKDLGFCATFYVCEFPGIYPDSTKSLTWKQIAKLNEWGFEIGNHTANHRPVVGISERQLVEELRYIERKCDSMMVPKPTSFAYPVYGADLYAIEILKEQGYHNARTGNDETYRVGCHPYYLPSYTIKGDDSTFFYNSVNRADENNVVILTFHGVPDIAHPGVSTPPTLFKEYMAYLKRNNFQVIAMRDLKLTN